MNSKFTLALIALVGVGVFALPSTMALFAGQHSFYNIDATGNQVPCQKCHGDIKSELNSNADSLNPDRSPGPHAGMSCEYCHRIEPGASSGDDAVWELHYVNGNDKRTMVIYVYDYERENFPETILNNATPKQINDSWVAAGGKSFLGLAVSNSTQPTSNSVLTLSGEPTYVPTFNSDGSAKDTNSNTSNSGVRLSSFRNNKWSQYINFLYPDPANNTQPTIDWYGAGSRVVNPGTEYHAASLVSCMECHGGEPPLGHETQRTVGPDGKVQCWDCHYGGTNGTDGRAGNAMRNLWAGGFGLTDKPDDTGAAEAHTPWVTTAGISRFGNGTGPRKANNDACIGCHTHVAVDITFKKAYLLKLEVNRNITDGIPGKYVMGNTSTAGDVIQETYGNASGQTYAVGNKTYYWDSSGVLYINGDTSEQINFPLTGSSGDTKEALLSSGP